MTFLNTINTPRDHPEHTAWQVAIRKVDVMLPGKGNSNSHGAGPVHLIITMVKWIRTRRLSIKNSLSLPSGVFWTVTRCIYRVQEGHGVYISQPKGHGVCSGRSRGVCITRAVWQRGPPNRRRKTRLESFYHLFHYQTVDFDPFIKSQLASSNQL